MRPIKFRGKRVDNGEWVHGFYYELPIQTGKRLSIIDQSKRFDKDGDSIDLYVVHSNTVGQFIGVHDKKGKEIYEGDRVRLTDPKGKCLPEDGDFIEFVYFKDGMFVSTEGEEYWQDESIHRSMNEGTWEYEVIGNIHDHATNN